MSDPNLIELIEQIANDLDTIENIVIGMAVVGVAWYLLWCWNTRK